MNTNKSPFDFVNALNKGKHIDDLEGYIPFLTNRSFSFHVDAILHAQEMNLYSNIPHNMQFQYYLHSLKPRNRFGWLKSDKNDDLITIQELYQVNKQRASEILRLLSAAQLDHIRKIKKVIKDDEHQYNGSIR